MLARIRHRYKQNLTKQTNKQTEKLARFFSFLIIIIIIIIISIHALYLKISCRICLGLEEGYSIVKNDQLVIEICAVHRRARLLS